MYFLDETDDWPEYQTVRDEIHRLEMKRVAVLEALSVAQSAFASGIVNEDLQAKVEALKVELGETERKLDESLSMYR
jgi:uncharacterized protein YceH (UPF0502 family)